MKAPERVQAALDAKSIGIRVIEFPDSTATAEQAAAAAGCPLGAIVKSLLFLGEDQPILVLVAGDRMADPRRIAARFGVGKKKVRLADAETVRNITSYDVGGVPPVGHPVSLPTLIDDSLGRFDTVWAAAGAGNAVFPIPFPLLAQITSGEVIPL